MKTIVLGVVFSLWACAQSSTPSHSIAVAHGIKNFTMQDVNIRLSECIIEANSRDPSLIIVIREKLSILKDVFSSPVFETRIVKEPEGVRWFKNKKVFITIFLDDLRKAFAEKKWQLPPVDPPLPNPETTKL